MEGIRILSSHKVATSLEQLADRVAEARTLGKKIVLCHGVFDLLHAGHLMHLAAARRQGDFLVVTVTPDRFVNKGPGRPAFAERMRAFAVAALEVVDWVSINEWPTAVEAIRLLSPDVYVKGQDYADATKDLTGGIKAEAAVVNEVGARIHFTNEQKFSSSHLINRFFSSHPSATQAYLEDLRTRYRADDILRMLDGYSVLRPLVVGEAIVDEYCYTTPLAKAPRESIIAAKYESTELFAGGAVATANHLAGFCNEVTLVASLGDDQYQEVIKSALKPNVNFTPIVIPDRPTTRKRRFIEPSHLTKLFELQYLDDTDIDGSVEERTLRSLEHLAASHDFVVLNDFGHGFITSRIRQLLCGSDFYLALNTQTNSANLGFNPITKYDRAQYCCIDQAEAKLASGLLHGSAVECGRTLMRRVNADWFMITTGIYGATLLLNDGTVSECPSLSSDVVDRVGAGDAFFALTSPWAYKENPSDLVAFVGNCVGALQVGIVGNRSSVEPIPLYRFISTLME